MIRQKGTRPLFVLVSAVLTAAFLAGCGSSGSEDGSDQFRDQTESALLDFGEEGDESALEEAAEVVQGFVAARAGEDWEAACAQLSRSMLDKIERLATTATDLEDKSCPSFLAAFTRLSAEEREESSIDAGSLREQGRRAFLIYYGGGEAVYAMPLNREGSEWKVASLTPRQLS